MNQQTAAHPEYENLQMVLGAIARWVEKYRYARGMRREMANYTPDQVASVARELGVHPSELAALAQKGPHAADLLNKLLLALGVEPDKLEHDDPMVMRDLQRLCVSCGQKRRCAHDLASDESAAHFRDYCPNAFTLDALLQAKQ